MAGGARSGLVGHEADRSRGLAHDPHLNHQGLVVVLWGEDVVQGLAGGLAAFFFRRPLMSWQAAATLSFALGRPLFFLIRSGLS